MTNLEIATDFTTMLKANKHIEAAAKYNSVDIESFEAMSGPMAHIKGAEAVKAKGEWWVNNHEIHSVEVEGPFANDNIFVVRFKMDVTSKMDNKRMQMDEVGIYTIENGKIVSERFCYLM
jgi:limonene-1,2-epoxide hydrolase